MHSQNTAIPQQIINYNIVVSQQQAAEILTKSKPQICFGDFFLEVLEHKKHLLAPSSYQNYLVVYRHFQPNIGNCQIYTLTAKMLDEHLDTLDISVVSRRTYIRILSSIFNIACKRKIIFENPCNDMRQYKVQHHKVDLELPTDDDIKSYLDTAQKTNDYFMYKLILLAVSTGMRLGEMLNLSKENISLDSNTIQVIGQLTASGANMPLKTIHSYRQIHVADLVLNKVLEHSPTHFLFTPRTMPSKQIARQTADKYIHKFFSQIANKPSGFCFHMLRHYHATKLLNSGIDLKEVSKRLGHASIATTADMYTHWQSTMDQRAAEVFRGITM